MTERRAAVAALGLAIAGCTAHGPGPDLDPPVDPPGYAALATAQNLRVALLQNFYSRGTVDMTWFDDEGREQSGQGSIDLWVDWPRCLAMQVTKLGEELVWLGCDESDQWLFELTGDEKILHVGPHADRADPDRPLALSPDVWRDLLGLAPLPEMEGDEPEPPVGWDALLDAWVVVVPRDGADDAGVLRMFLDRTSGLPRRIELRSPDGSLWAHSEHHQHRVLSVEQPGMSVVQWPRIAVPIDLYQPDGSWLKISLSRPTGIVDDQPFDRVCDLDLLIQAFRPDRIEGTASPR